MHKFLAKRFTILFNTEFFISLKYYFLPILHNYPPEKYLFYILLVCKCHNIMSLGFLLFAQRLKIKIGPPMYVSANIIIVDKHEIAQLLDKNINMILGCIKYAFG